MILFNLREKLRASPAKRDRAMMVIFGIALVCDIALWLVLILSFFRSTEYIILGYTIYFGISALGHWYWILLLPFIGLCVVAINMALSFLTYLNYKILSQFLAISALIANGMLLVAGLLLVYFNL